MHTMNGLKLYKNTAFLTFRITSQRCTINILISLWYCTYCLSFKNTMVRRWTKSIGGGGVLTKCHQKLLIEIVNFNIGKDWLINNL